MKISKEQLATMLKHDEYPLSLKYEPEWVLENEMGPNALWLVEWLVRAMKLKPGMRVLDMGCGRAMTSIFLAKEFGVQVWANDLWIGATENWQRVVDAGVEHMVCPIHAEAHTLPYAEGFFDAIVSVDSYNYYGTCDLYLNYFVKFVKPGGQLGLILPALMREFNDDVPEHLTRNGWWDRGECFSLRTIEWWRRHWAQTHLVDIEVADTLADGWKDWLRFEEIKLAAGSCRFENEAPALKDDQGRYLGLARLVARRVRVRAEGVRNNDSE